MKTIMNSAMTRPRMAGSVAIWTEVFAVTLIVRPKTPIGTMSSANSQKDGTSAATTSRTPKARAATTSSRMRAVPRRAASSAPATEPTAISVLKRLYAPAPAWKTSSA